jgi:hypothetical protein
MLRPGTGLALALIWGSLAVAQDSGPGPVSGTGSQQYAVTVLKMGSVTTGTFDFAVTTEEPSTEPTTTSIVTTGTFTSTLGTTATTGTWTAIDIGNYAIWFGNAQGTTGNQIITGIATPDFIAGRIVTTSNTNTGRGRFLRALFNSSFFFGTAVEAETPPTTTTGN